MKKLIIFLISVIAISAQSQQKYPYEIDKLIFEPKEFYINRETIGHVNSLTFTPDGNEVYFSYINDKRKVKIYFSKFENGKWSNAKPVSFSSEENDNNPFLTLDGKRLYFTSQRPVVYNPLKNDYDIWYVEKEDSVWSEPVRIANKEINSSANEGTPAADKFGNLYFSSTRKEGFGKTDIYLAKFNGKDFTDVIHLGSNVNSAFDDYYPMPDPISDKLLFSSYRGEGSGLAEIYAVSMNNYKADNLKALNGIVNTEGYEYAPSFDPTGKYIFYVRILNGERRIFYINKEVVGIDFKSE